MSFVQANDVVTVQNDADLYESANLSGPTEYGVVSKTVTRPVYVIHINYHFMPDLDSAFYNIN